MTLKGIHVCVFFELHIATTVVGGDFQDFQETPYKIWTFEFATGTQHTIYFGSHVENIHNIKRNFCVLKTVYFW